MLCIYHAAHCVVCLDAPAGVVDRCGVAGLQGEVRVTLTRSQDALKQRPRSETS